VKKAVIFIIKRMMKVEDVQVICILYNILLEFFETEIPRENCSDIGQLDDAINRNAKYKIILVCKTEDVDKLDRIISSKYILKTYAFGKCTFNITNKQVTKVDTNEQDLLLRIAGSVKDYIHHEQMELQKLQDHSIAENLAKEKIHLIEQMERIKKEHC
jgi:hypothetical protein